MNLNHYFKSLISNCRSLELQIIDKTLLKHTGHKTTYTVHITPLALEPHEALGKSVQLMINVTEKNNSQHFPMKMVSIDNYRTDQKLNSLLRLIGDQIEAEYKLQEEHPTGYERVVERSSVYKTIIL